MCIRDAFELIFDIRLIYLYSCIPWFWPVVPSKRYPLLHWFDLRIWMYKYVVVSTLQAYIICTYERIIHNAQRAFRNQLFVCKIKLCSSVNIRAAG